MPSREPDPFAPSALSRGVSRGQVIPLALRKRCCLGLPADLEQPDGVLEAAEHILTAVSEEKALARTKPAYDIRGQDLAGLRMSGDPRGHDHGGAEEVASLFDRLARIQADANMYRFLIRVSTRPVLEFLECP